MLIAIYSRKSRWSARGESVENQVRMCMEYIKANIPEGKDAEIIVYEDEGFSGKDTKRPRLRQMLEDMKNRHFHYLVCYRLDRLGRNVADLALLIDGLNREKTEFVSIRERFDTTTPMGKAMLYFSGVLAQMEREQIAERVRDNMVMLARDGRWLGGNTPFGFTVREEKKIQPDGKIKKACRLEADGGEIPVVKQIFARYLKLQSLSAVARYLDACRILTRRGKAFTASALRDILTNPVYCTADREAWDYFYSLGCRICMEKEEASGDRGLIGYGKTTSGNYKNESCSPKQWILAPGKHPGIISGKDFVKVQNLLQANKKTGRKERLPKNRTSLLAGLLYCSCGYRMRPKYYGDPHRQPETERKFSYRCPHRDASRQTLCRTAPAAGNCLDRQVCQLLLQKTKKRFRPETLLYLALERIETKQKVPGSETAFLQLQIHTNKEKIRNLLSALERSQKDPAFIRQVEEKIRTLEMDCEKLEEKIRRKQKEKDHGEETCREQAKTLGEVLLSFDRLFASMSVSEKREYLSLWIEQAVWNGEDLKIRLRC